MNDVMIIKNVLQKLIMLTRTVTLFDCLILQHMVKCSVPGANVLKNSRKDGLNPRDRLMKPISNNTHGNNNDC
jgi:hypothetical protein